MLHSKEKVKILERCQMWTEQDEKALKALQKRKESDTYLRTLQNVGTRIGTAIEGHAECIQEVKWDVEFLSPYYRKVNINVILLGAAADKFLNDNTKNT